MSDKSYLQWPFFDQKHRELQTNLDAWASVNIAQNHNDDVDQACRNLVHQLGDAGWLTHAIAGTGYGAANEQIDTREIGRAHV